MLLLLGLLRLGCGGGLLLLWRGMRSMYASLCVDARHPRGSLPIGARNLIPNFILGLSL